MVWRCALLVEMRRVLLQFASRRGLEACIGSHQVASRLYALRPSMTFSQRCRIFSESKRRPIVERMI